MWWCCLTNHSPAPLRPNRRQQCRRAYLARLKIPISHNIKSHHAMAYRCRPRLTGQIHQYQWSGNIVQLLECDPARYQHQACETGVPTEYLIPFFAHLHSHHGRSKTHCECRFATVPSHRAFPPRAASGSHAHISPHGVHRQNPDARRSARGEPALAQKTH